MLISDRCFKKCRSISIKKNLFAFKICLVFFVVVIFCSLNIWKSASTKKIQKTFVNIENYP